MAEQDNNTSLVRSDHGLSLNLSDFNAAGKKDEYIVHVPDTPQWQDIMIRAAFLKKGPMADQTFATCVCIVRYADAMGLNEVLGDLYIVSGRISTTADAKIRHALGSGLIAGYNVEIIKGKPINIVYQLKGADKTWTGEDMHVKVTVNVKGWEHPVIYECDLRDWMNPQNAAWRDHTAYMLRKNALSKALSEVAPIGVDAEEIPSPVHADIPDVIKALMAKTPDVEK